MNNLSGNRNPSSRAETLETAQEAVWKGAFGHEYTNRNTYEPAALDELYRKNYGLTRKELNESFLRGIAKEASFLEVGCNAGNQLLLLQQMGWANLSGLELQPYALEIARSRLPHASLKMGSALTLPYPDSSFDVVFTCGVLIHIAPTDLPRVIDEIQRGNGTLGRLASDTLLYADMRRTVLGLDSLFADLKANPRKYFNFSVFGGR